MAQNNFYYPVYLNLEKELLYLSDTICFDDSDKSHQLSVYSIKIAELLMRCAIEIESISKDLFFDNGGKKQDTKGQDIEPYFDTDCLEFLENHWHISEKKVLITASNFYFTKDENKILTPLYNTNKKGKCDWKKAYQAIKHNRVKNIKQANIKNLVRAMAALFLLNVYYKDEKISSKYYDYRKLDMSFGSNIFSLKLPNDNNMMDVVNGIYSGEILKSQDSPYIVKYTDNTYKQINESRKKRDNDRIAYWNNQPELRDPIFNKQIIEAKQREEKDPRQRVMFFWELSKYRLNKKTPTDLAFEERKRRFVHTNEWSGRIRLLNKHLEENELTEDNLQKEIDHAGIQAGMELEQIFENEFMRNCFTDGCCEIVLDKGNIKYN